MIGNGMGQTRAGPRNQLFHFEGGGRSVHRRMIHVAAKLVSGGTDPPQLSNNPKVKPRVSEGLAFDAGGGGVTATAATASGRKVEAECFTSHRERNPVRFAQVLRT